MLTSWSFSKNLLRLNLCRTITKTSFTASQVNKAVECEKPEFTETNQKDGVRIITLNQPRKCNSLSMPMMEALNRDLTRDLSDKSLRCIILSANGAIWSAGHDLKELCAATPTQQREIFEKLTEIILNIRQAPVPVIARVNGLAAAAGCQLVTSCDMLVASEKSSFSTPGSKFGIFCSTPGVALARSINSRSKAAYMLMTSLPITAKEAYETGLITRLVAESELDAEISKIVEAIKIQSRAVIAHGKEFFYKQLTMQRLDEAYCAASEAMVDNLQFEDGKEGLLSFVQKRKPEWKHE